MVKRGFGAARSLLGAGFGALAALSAAPALAGDLLGQPTPGGIDLQPGASPMRHEAISFHNFVLLPVVFGISILVAALLVYVVVRFNAKSNPTPARFTHNTPVEIVWTALPVLLLMFIAIFSFRLLYDYHNMPKPDVTVKVTGNQWFWSYEYPSEGIAEYTSNPLPEAKAEAKGPGLFRLAVDNPMVVPVNKTVQVLATGADVLHAFFIPAFGVQVTTIPGRVNQTWFRAEKTGVYYGQCNELCGINHSFMPIEVDVVTEPEYRAWVAAHGKKPAPAAIPVSTASPSLSANPGSQPATTPSGAGIAGPTTGATGATAPAGQPPKSQTGPRGKAQLPGSEPAMPAAQNSTAHA